MRSFATRVWGFTAFAAIVLFAAGGAGAQTTHCVPSSFSGSCDDSHATIQAAITDSIAGDTVLVAPGTYVENLTVGVDITLQGAQAGVDARGRVAGAPNPATESIIAPASLVGLTLLTGSAARPSTGSPSSAGRGPSNRGPGRSTISSFRTITSTASQTPGSSSMTRASTSPRRAT